MASDGPHERRRRRLDRERVVRTLTFWLRPEFLLRVVNRFQKVAGFDRSIALASGALTAVIPLTIIASALSSQLGGKGTADRIFDLAVVGVRQDLTYKVLNQAVITDDTGAIVYNLPQQDMLALRVVVRFGFAIAKPVSRNAPGGGFPLAVLNQA